LKRRKLKLAVDEIGQKVDLLEPKEYYIYFLMKNLLKINTSIDEFTQNAVIVLLRSEKAIGKYNATTQTSDLENETSLNFLEKQKLNDPKMHHCLEQHIKATIY
jgi:hypothetical protein